MGALLERWFQLTRHRATIRAEVLGGITTFAAMAYIIVVNPAILQAADIPLGPSTVATILATVFGTVVMALYANRPIAVAPYMGENAFIAFGLSALAVGMQITWQQRLGTVFVSGAAFFVLTLCGLRVWLANAISPSMKHSFAVGIGVFLLFIGLFLTGIVVKAEAAAVPLKIGSLRDPRVLLAVGNFTLMAVLLYWNVPGAILLGMIATGAVGCLLNLAALPEQIVSLPWQEPYNIGEIALQLDIVDVLRLAFLPILLTLFLMSFLDTLGTLVAVGAVGNMLDKHGNFPDMHKPMLVDSLSCMFSALVGTSTSGAYIESATGIREGARTGLAALVTAMLFAAALFFIPLVSPLQDLKFAYGPALMIVGVLMLGAVRKIDFEDLTEAVPAVVTIVMMVFTYNIANGLTAGLVLYPVFKVAAGRWRDLHPGAIALALLCASYFIFGAPH